MNERMSGQDQTNSTVTELPLIADFDRLPSVAIPASQLDKRMVVGFDSRDPRSRPFNLLRTQLAKLMAGRNIRMIGVTSATPAAGKTFTSVNLAAALSKMENRQVILVDLDLRRGSVLKMLGVGAEMGVGSYLAGELDNAARLACRINNNQLAIIPTLASSDGSSELLSSPRFRTMMNALRNQGENSIIVCDLPPVFANDDAMLCMQHLDGYLMVVDYGRTTRKQIEETMTLLSPSVCIGTILNRYQGGFADPYGYGYGDMYGLKSYGNNAD